MKINKKTQKALDDMGPVVGIAVNAFSRVVPSSFLKDYEIISGRWRGESASVAKDNKVYCLQKKFPGEIPNANTWEILGNKNVGNLIKRKGNPWILIYCPDPKIEKICQEKGWRLIANSFSIKSYFDNKKIFREILNESGVEAIPGETVKIEELKDGFFEKMIAKYGEKLVFQMAEVTGGGLGTAFVETKDDFLKFIEKVRKNKIKKPELEHVNVTKYIDGIPSSIVSCATKFGVLAGTIQAQIQDIPEVVDLTMGSGIFCGHDWSYFSKENNLTEKAQEIAKKIGNLMYAKGYKGIFGLDLLIEKETGRVFPVECNPRYTDAFPAVSMIYLKKGIIPMDLYHILELTGKEYEVDVNLMNRLYAKGVSGSQIIISNLVEQEVEVRGDLKGGVYKDDGNGLTYIREGYRYEDLEDENEFVITEGAPFSGTRIKGDYRIMRLIFKKGILEAKNQLTDWSKNVIEKVYNRLSLKEIE